MSLSLIKRLHATVFQKANLEPHIQVLNRLTGYAGSSPQHPGLAGCAA